ncbi:hypothetical protein [Xenococcus sp. PCC 7305]|nr:hypothetical protein [Xenococcus sp. PCC 7305]
MMKNNLLCWVMRSPTQPQSYPEYQAEYKPNHRTGSDRKITHQ